MRGCRSACGAGSGGEPSPLQRKGHQVGGWMAGARVRPGMELNAGGGGKVVGDAVL